MSESISPLLAVCDFPDTGRGVRCTQAVGPGTELIAVPLERCFYAAASRAVPELQCLALSTLDDYTVVILHVLVERAKGKRSAWHEYVQQLPTSFDSPLFWTEEERLQLSGTVWHTICAQEKEDLEAVWRTVQAVMPPDFARVNRVDWESYTLESRPELGPAAWSYPDPCRPAPKSKP